MLFLDELDRHRPLNSVTLRYEAAEETVSYEWRAKGGRPSDCWMTADGRVYVPADIVSVTLTEFFQHEIIWSHEEQKIRYIRIKQPIDIESGKTQSMVFEADGKEALAGEEHGLATVLGSYASNVS